MLEVLRIALQHFKEDRLGGVYAVPLPGRALFEDDRLTPEGREWLHSLHQAFQCFLPFHGSDGHPVIHDIYLRNGPQTVGSNWEAFDSVVGDVYRQRDKLGLGGMWVCQVILNRGEGTLDTGGTIDFYLGDFMDGGQRAMRKLQRVVAMIRQRAVITPDTNPGALVAAAAKQLNP